MTHRFLQGGPPLPNYTSPPLADALALTPVDFRNDAVIQGLREAHTAGNCNASYPCVIPFLPTSTTKASPVGVLFYGGALVDPRSYAPLCHLLASRYGLPVAVPVFGADIAFTGCNSTGITLDRVSAAIPSVQKWVLVGHSLGGVTAASAYDYALTLSEADSDQSLVDRLAGLALLGSIVESGGPTGPLCGKPVNFSSYDFPMADVTGSNDLILLQSEADGDDLLLPNNTLFIQIPGGNHAQFGSYDDSEREALLGQMDGEPFIAPYVQWDLSASAIYYVASRSGLELPPLPNSTCETGNDTSDAYRSSTCNIHTWIITMVVLLFYRKVF